MADRALHFQTCEPWSDEALVDEGERDFEFVVGLILNLVQLLLSGEMSHFRSFYHVTPGLLSSSVYQTWDLFVLFYQLRSAAPGFHSSHSMLSSSVVKNAMSSSASHRIMRDIWSTPWYWLLLSTVTRSPCRYEFVPMKNKVRIKSLTAGLRGEEGQAQVALISGEFSVVCCRCHSAAFRANIFPTPDCSCFRLVLLGWVVRSPSPRFPPLPHLAEVLLQERCLTRGAERLFENYK